MTAHLGGIPPDELRALIRDVLRDVLPAADGRRAAPSALDNGKPGEPAWRAPATPPSGMPAGQPGAVESAQSIPKPPSVTPSSAATQETVRPVAGAGPAAPRPVRLETDADLRQFALDILRLADNPARRRDLLAGRLTFTLAGRARDSGPADDQRIEAGAVTERAVQSAAKAGRRIVLGRRAVLTPLARDRALALGVPIEKER
jgi:hypothetical protein